MTLFVYLLQASKEGDAETVHIQSCLPVLLWKMLLALQA